MPARVAQVIEREGGATTLKFYCIITKITGRKKYLGVNYSLVPLYSGRQ